jgi:hypothetical protein
MPASAVKVISQFAGSVDNGYVAGVRGPLVYFATSGPQRIPVLLFLPASTPRGEPARSIL